MKRAVLLGVVVAAVTFVGCSESQEAPEERGVAVGTGGAGANVDDPGEFVRDMALKNMAEIELSRMAADRAARADVKAFAQMMIRDHGAAADALKSRVPAAEWPAELDDRHKETVDDLQRKQGADFDRGYVEAMIEGHENFAAKLESRLDVQSLNEWKTAAASRARSNALPDPNDALADVKVRPNASDDAMTRAINEWAADTYPIAQKHLDAARALDNAANGRSTD